MTIQGITFSLNVSLIFDDDRITAEEAEDALRRLVEKIDPTAHQLIDIGWGDSFDHTAFTPVGSYSQKADVVDEAAQLDVLLEVAELLGTDPEDLDDLVHDLVRRYGSSINNGGLHDQFAYLISEIGAADIREMLRAQAADRAFLAG